MHLNRKTAVATIITIAFLIASTMQICTLVQAQTQYTNPQDGAAKPLPAGVTPDVTYATIAHLNFRPSPIGLNQPLLVNIWMQPPTHVSRYFTGLTVTITKPDGTKETIGPMNTYYGDATAWFEYTPDQVGNWTIKFDFPGAYYPAGNYTAVQGEFTMGANLNAPLSIYYKPSFDGPYTFVVQQDMVGSWQPSPLPTDYWTRPVYPENREWWPILGNFPGTGTVAGVGRSVTLADWPANTNTYMSNYKYVPYVQGPKSAHIVWMRQAGIGGLAGGTLGDAGIQGKVTGIIADYNNGGGPSIVFMGRCYQNINKVYNGITQNVWQCYDLRTGEVYWEKTGVTQVPTMILYSEREVTVVPGETSSTLGMRLQLMYVGGGRLITYNPWTGGVDINCSISPLTTGEYYASYDWPYFLTVQNIGNTTKPNYRLINWTVTGDFTPAGFNLQNFRLQVCNNISWPFSSLGVVDYEAGIAVTSQGVTTSSTGVTYGQMIMAANIYTGNLLWNTTTDTTSGTGGFFSGSTAVADHGKYAVRLNDGHWHCWDLHSGKQLWISELSSWPWGTFGCYNVASYGGNIIANQYDGIVAYNWNTGKVSWHYKYVPAYPYESVYGNSKTGEEYYPFYTSTGSSGGGQPYIADGVYYCYNDEHSISEPIPRGYKLHAINATTGEGIWNISGRTPPFAVADGYLVGANMYDSNLYVFGKGKSTTTVTAPDVSVSSGTAIVVKGTVTDLSPAQPNTPCVSKDSMSTQMEYLHMQHPIDGLDHNIQMTGVPVTLTAIDSNGAVTNIGTTTTNAYYGTFGYTWTPPKEGTYTITASFSGDDSYGSSGAATTVSVGPAPTSTDNNQQQQIVVPDYTLTILAGIVAVIITVVLVGIVLYRKK